MHGMPRPMHSSSLKQYFSPFALSQDFLIPSFILWNFFIKVALNLPWCSNFLSG